jgi:PAS domain S-box-containing protein
VFETLPEPVLRFDAQGRLRYTNAAARCVLGDQAALGTPIESLAAFGEARGEWRAALERALAGAAQDLRVHLGTGADGAGYDVRLLRETDALDGVPGVTALLRPLDGAADSLNALHDALAHAGEMVLEVDADGLIRAANARAREQLGLLRGAPAQRWLGDLELELSRAAWRERYARLLARGVERHETRYRVPDGTISVDVVARHTLRAGRGTVVLLARDISAHLHIEARLADTAERFRALFDESPVANLLLDAHGRIVQANRAAAQLLGCSGVDLIGRVAESLLHVDESESAARLREVLALGGTDVIDRGVRLNVAGAHAWARLVVRAWSNGEHGRQALLVLEDVTERRAAALELETAARDQHLLLESMTAGVARVRDGRVIAANRAFAQLFGLPGPSEGAVLEQLVRATAEPLPTAGAGAAAGAECRFARADGTSLTCLVQVRAIDAHEAIYTFQDVTELLRSRASAARSALELDMVSDSTEVALLHLTDGRVVRCNARAAAMFGGAQGPIGHAFIALLDLDPDDPPPAWLDIGAGAQTTEARMRGADGTPFWALVSLRPSEPARPAAGQIVAVLNIDARKKIEEELRETRNFLDLMIESLPVVVAVRSAAGGRFISLNRAGERFLGRSRETIIGRTWLEAFDADFAAQMAALDARVIASGQPIDQPRETVISADGREHTVHRRVLPIFEPGVREGGRRPRYVMSIVDDLADVIRAETALHDTEARFRELAEHIDALVFIASADLGTLSYVSPFARELIGVAPEDLLQDPRLALERVTPEDRPVLMRRLPHLLARLRRLQRCETSVRVQLAGGAQRTLVLRLTPVPGYDGDGAVRIFGIAEDASRTEAAFEERVTEIRLEHSRQLRDLNLRTRSALHGLSEMLQHHAYAKPEVADQLQEAASRINAIAQIHTLKAGAELLPLVELIRSIFAGLGAMHHATLLLEAPSTGVAVWGVPAAEAVPFVLAINELAAIALQHRGAREFRVIGRLTPRGAGVELRIEHPGRLKEGFDLARLAASTSGHGLVKALLPQRGARLAVEQLGPLVVTRLELVPPAIRADPTPRVEPAGS